METQMEFLANPIKQNNALNWDSRAWGMAEKRKMLHLMFKVVQRTLSSPGRQLVLGSRLLCAKSERHSGLAGAWKLRPSVSTGPPGMNLLGQNTQRCTKCCPGDSYRQCSPGARVQGKVSISNLFFKISSQVRSTSWGAQEDKWKSTKWFSNMLINTL